MTALALTFFNMGFTAETPHPMHRAGGGILVTSGNIPLKPLEKCTNPNWLKEKKEYSVLGSISGLNEQTGWVKLSFSFIPEKSGEIRLCLLGGGTCKPDYFQKKPNQCWVVWDTLSLQGAKIVNGDFEDIGTQKYPNAWMSQSMVSGECCGIKPHQGRFMLPINENHQAVQDKIQVTEGQKVTVSAFIRFLKCVPQK